MFYQLDEETFAQHLKHFQLAEKLRISSLSKGQKRQALFSIALSLDLRLLMIDEVFDGLDWNVRRYLMRCLTDKISDESMGVLLVSHSLKEIKGICDHCFLMKDQTIVAQQDLLENRWKSFRWSRSESAGTPLCAERNRRSAARLPGCPRRWPTFSRSVWRIISA